MDNEQHGWDLNGNAKTAFWDLGSYATQGSYLQSMAFLREGKNHIFCSILTYVEHVIRMEPVLLSDTRCELHHPYFSKPTTSGKHLRCPLKLHPEEIQRYAFATVFL